MPEEASQYTLYHYVITSGAPPMAEGTVREIERKKSLQQSKQCKSYEPNERM